MAILATTEIQFPSAIVCLSPEVRKCIQAALNWNLDKVIRFLVAREHRDQEYVQRIVFEYRRYLAIIASQPERRFPISEPVDLAWHTHLLFTRDYIAMSEKVRGEYIHHDPVLSLDQKKSLEPDYLNGTLRCYRDLFDEEPPIDLWPLHGAICWSGYRIHS